jgi:hypothetical protein
MHVAHNLGADVGCRGYTHGLWHTAPRRAVLCRAVLYRAVPCRTVLCRAVPRCVAPYQCHSDVLDGWFATLDRDGDSMVSSVEVARFSDAFQGPGVPGVAPRLPHRTDPANTYK